MDKKLSPQQVAELIDMYKFKSGLKYPEVCDNLRITYITLVNWRKGKSKKVQAKKLAYIKSVIEGDKNV